MAAGSALAGLPATAGLSAGAGDPVAEPNVIVPSFDSVSVSWLLAISYVEARPSMWTYSLSSDSSPQNAIVDVPGVIVMFDPLVV